MLHAAAAAPHPAEPDAAGASQLLHAAAHQIRSHYVVTTLWSVEVTLGILHSSVERAARCVQNLNKQLALVDVQLLVCRND